jgi:hypothetical protein
MSNLNYEQKYLKYKNKYFKLKGGDDERERIAILEQEQFDKTHGIYYTTAPPVIVDKLLDSMKTLTRYIFITPHIAWKNISSMQNKNITLYYFAHDLNGIASELTWGKITAITDLTFDNNIVISFKLHVTVGFFDNVFIIDETTLNTFWTVVYN